MCQWISKRIIHANIGGFHIIFFFFFFVGFYSHSVMYAKCGNIRYIQLRFDTRCVFWCCGAFTQPETIYRVYFENVVLYRWSQTTMNGISIKRPDTNKPQKISHLLTLFASSVSHQMEI